MRLRFNLSTFQPGSIPLLRFLGSRLFQAEIFFRRVVVDDDVDAFTRMDIAAALLDSRDPIFLAAVDIAEVAADALRRLQRTPVIHRAAGLGEIHPTDARRGTVDVAVT